MTGSSEVSRANLSSRKYHILLVRRTPRSGANFSVLGLQHGAGPGNRRDGEPPIFNYGLVNYVQPDVKNYPRFIELVELAKQFEVSGPVLEQFEFFHGYSVLQRATELQAPETADDAARLRSANLTLAMFKEAIVLFERGKGHADRTAGLEFQVFMDNAVQYLDIQERLIERANRQ